jgi:hypothetical protein
MLNLYPFDSQSEIMRFLDVKSDYALMRVFGSEGSLS